MPTPAAGTPSAHDRCWHVVGRSADHLVLRLIDGGAFVAQATVTAVEADRPGGAHPGRRVPGGPGQAPRLATRGRVGGRRTGSTAAGWLYRVSSRGKQDGQPMPPRRRSWWPARSGGAAGGGGAGVRRGRRSPAGTSGWCGGWSRSRECRPPSGEGRTKRSARLWPLHSRLSTLYFCPAAGCGTLSRASERDRRQAHADRRRQRHPRPGRGDRRSGPAAGRPAGGARSSTAGTSRSPETVAAFAGVPTHFVFGNWDKDRARLQAAIKAGRRGVLRVVRGAGAGRQAGGLGPLPRAAPALPVGALRLLRLRVLRAHPRPRAAPHRADRWWPTPGPCSGPARRPASCWTWPPAS